MFWADRLAKKIIDTNKYDHFWVDDMKTPSGRVHVGALRGVVVHGLIQTALKEQGQDAHYSYVINDMDPMDGFPHYLDESFKQYMGMPLYRIPSPEEGHISMAKLYAKEFIGVFNSLGFEPEIIWSSEQYKQGKFDAVIKQVLNNVEKIRHLYHDISGYDKPENWYPYQVICPECGKVGSTITTGWDGQKVSFECRKDLVDWAQGCGYKGEIEPVGDNGKLMWKVDWAAHWKTIGITVEGAGKDHMTDGGSHDLSGAICEQVLDYQTPYGFIYEWFLAKGGSKMSSSKGVGVSAKEISQTLPPEILRFLLVKTPYRRAIMFDPSENQSILQLFDEFDQYQDFYYKQPNSDEARVWQLSQIETPPEKQIFLSRFRDVVNHIQNPKVDVYQEFENVKGSPLDEAELEELEKRISFAKIWIDKYAPEKFNFQVSEDIPQEASDLSEDQIKYLKEVASMLADDWSSPDDFQQALYQKSKDMEISAKKAFQSIYMALIGKTHGPKAAWLILENKDIAIDRFANLEILEQESKDKIESYKSKYLSLHDSFKNTYPSASIGFAYMEGVNITDFSEELEQEKKKLLDEYQNLTTAELGEYFEIKSYRNMYKDMGVDWHSRRPSPEALLRRVAQNKGLYRVNTCVDAYNLIVMKNRISIGAFDADQFSFPCTIQVAKGGEEIDLLGKDGVTQINQGEVYYADKNGPYNIDYNYRDAERTKVTLNTKNIIINVDGVYDITPTQVQQSLKETIEIIQKYCGGKVIEQGIIKAS